MARRTLAIFLVILALSASAQGATYYVASDGTPAGDGSKERPWHSVEQALAKVGAGHTIVVRPGIYRGPVEIPRTYAGTKESPTVLKSEVKWKAVIVGDSVHGISTGDECHWVVVDGFQVHGAGYDGIKLSGEHGVVRNCWVHHNQSMGIAMHDNTGGVIENNLIEFNGGNIQFDHGVYASGDGLTIRGNVVRHNASFGLHLYEKIKNSVIANNLVYGQVRRRGIVVACPDGGGKNRVVNNTVVEAEPLAITNGDGEVIANNILVAEGARPLAFDEQTRRLVFDYNLCVPESEWNDPHRVTGEPRFVEEGRGAFWLGPGSAAIGKGSLEYAPEQDFWGRRRDKKERVDLGAFEFVPALAGEEARTDGHVAWQYYDFRSGDRLAPDFWALPPAAHRK